MSDSKTSDPRNELPTDLISTREAARLVGACQQTILRWVLRGKLVGYRRMHRWFVSKEDLLDIIQRFGPEDATKRREDIKRSLPASNREKRAEEKWVTERLKRAGIL